MLKLTIPKQKLMRAIIMKITWVLIIIMFFLLSACGLIPKQTLNDPFKLKESEINITIGKTVTTQASGLGDLQVHFEDADSINLPVSPQRALFKFTLGTSATLKTTSDFVPCGIVITNINAQITLADSSQELSLNIPILSERILLEQVKGTKNYSNKTQAATISAEISRAELSKIESILTTGGINTVTVNLDVDFASIPEPPSGSILTLTFDKNEALINF